MIDKLEMFIALAQARHFGRAAEAIGVTQPTLSAAIKQLEDQLGVMLVQRGSRFGGLTPEGQRVLEWARRIVGDTRTMKQELRAAKEGLSGNLRLAVIPTALSAVTELTTRFAARHPNVRFQIRSAASDDILHMLDDLSVDAGITYLDNDPLGRVVTVPMYDESFTLVMREDAPEAALPHIRWADLGRLPLALLSTEMQNRRIISGHLARAGLEITPSVETNSTIVLISHVIDGGWYAILPPRTLDPFLPHAPLATVPIVEPDAHNAVGLIAPWREPHTPVIEALLQAAKRHSA